MQYHAEPNRVAPDDNNSQDKMACRQTIARLEGELEHAKQKGQKFYEVRNQPDKIANLETELSEAKQRLATYSA